MNTDNTQHGAEPSPASAGSHGERGCKWHYGIGPHWIPLTNHDAAPTARASERECTTHAGIGGTQNDAVPAADGEGTRHQEGSRVRASATPTGNTQGPVAWAVRRKNPPVGEAPVLCWCESEMRSVEKSLPGCTVIPLYRSPAITDEERGAVEHFAREFKGENAATLRSLLKRTSKGTAGER